MDVSGIHFWHPTTRACEFASAAHLMERQRASLSLCEVASLKGINTMKNLQPLELYLTDLSATYKSLGKVFGLGMAVLLIITLPLIIPHSASMSAKLLMASIAIVLFTGIGLVAGYFWSLGLTFCFKRMITAIYHGRPPFNVSPPSDDYCFRLPCSLKASSRLAIGGVLFIKPGRLTFAPHSRNLKSHRQPQTIEITPESILTLEPRAYSRVFGNLPPFVRITHRDSHWMLSVPMPEDTLQKLRQALDGALF